MGRVAVRFGAGWSRGGGPGVPAGVTVGSARKNCWSIAEHATPPKRCSEEAVTALCQAMAASILPRSPSHYHRRRLCNDVTMS